MEDYLRQVGSGALGGLSHAFCSMAALKSPQDWATPPRAIVPTEDSRFRHESISDLSLPYSDSGRLVLGALPN